MADSEFLYPTVIFGAARGSSAPAVTNRSRCGNNPVGVWHCGAVADPFNLQRFVDAQADVYDRVRAELRAGAKRGHWIWFIFPQIASLGRSGTAQQFAIASLDEAKAYLQHPTLGPRLRECTKLVLDVEGRSAEEIFGYPDYLKFRSCMTLFSTAAPDNTLFKSALLKYFHGQPDQPTLDILARQST